MSRSRKRLLVRLAFAVALFASGCSALVTVDVTGGWAGHLTWMTGPATGLWYPFYLDLAQSDDEISGEVMLTSQGTDMYTISIAQGRARGSTVEFTAAGVNDRIPTPVNVTFAFDGTASGDAMSGTGSANIGGTAYEFTWTATLVAPPPAEE